MINRTSWHYSCIALVSSQRHSHYTLSYIVSHPSDIISYEQSCHDILIVKQVIFIIIGYHGMILVSHSYWVRDTRIVPFRTSYRILLTSYRTRSTRAIWCRKGAIRCTKGCDTSVSDSKRVRYKNHAMMFYLSLNCSIVVLA